MPDTADVAFYALISCPSLRIFGVRPKDGVRHEIESMSFTYVRSAANGFVKSNCRDAKVVVGGESMTPNTFEKKILERKVGRWETAVRIESDGDESRTFHRWFEETYLGDQGKSMKRASTKTNLPNNSEPAPDPAPVVKQVAPAEPAEADSAKHGDEGDEHKGTREVESDDDDREKVSPDNKACYDTSSIGIDLPPSKRRRVTVRTRGVPTKFPDYLTGELGLVREASGRIVAVRAALPFVSFSTLRLFFANHTDERALMGLVSSEEFECDSSGGRVCRAGSDPLGRGVIFSFLEDVGRDEARRRYYLYDPSRAEFVKFCGFDGDGAYVGFGKTRAVSSPDALYGTAAFRCYLNNARRFQVAYAISWRAVVEDYQDDENPLPVFDVDTQTAMNDFPFDTPLSHSVSRFIVEAVKDGGDLRKKLTLRHVVRSLGRSVTNDERVHVAEVMRWLLLKLKVV